MTKDPHDREDIVWFQITLTLFIVAWLAIAIARDFFGASLDL